MPSPAANDLRHQENPPRVSIVMAAYNSAAYIGEAIDSVLAQTMEDFELVIVDDGSTDHSPEIMARYEQDARVRVHRQNNQGIGGATNTGLRLARSEYIGIFDSDDVMESGRLAIQTAYLDQHPEVAAVGTQWLEISSRGDIVGMDRQPTNSHDAFTFMFGFFALHHPTVMVRKEVLLACGGYDTTIKRGAIDYRMFANLLLAGHKMTNSPYVLTRWRLNPSGATHGNALAQTQDCIDIRASAFAQLAHRDPQRADQIAQDLVRTFPGGSWFDEKVARVVSQPIISPVLQRWRELAAQDVIPDREAACVDWLHDEETHAERLADVLRRDGLHWLAQLAAARASLDANIGTPSNRPRPATPATRTLTLLVPTEAGDERLAERINLCSETLPAGSEIVVFSTDGASINVTALRRHNALHVLPVSAPAAAWLQALSSASGAYMSCMAANGRHHPDFLSQGLAALQGGGSCSLVYAPADVYYLDALDNEGRPFKDPAPQPRWTRETLLGRNKANLSCMIFRRELLGEIIVHIEETGPMTSWAIARNLLGCADPFVLNLRNAEFAPKIGIANHIIEAVIQRLVSGYLDTGRGCIPLPTAWARLSAAQGLERLRALDALLLENRLCIHPGNAVLIADFAARFSQRPVFHPVVNHLLIHHYDMALPRLGRHSAWAGRAYGAWRLWLRAYHKLRRVSVRAGRDGKEQTRADAPARSH